MESRREFLASSIGSCRSIASELHTCVAGRTETPDLNRSSSDEMAYVCATCRIKEAFRLTHGYLLYLHVRTYVSTLDVPPPSYLVLDYCTIQGDADHLA
jgi:hypothetical protein